ncbi:hypothetical protein ACIRD6_37285 [Streptomyces sp. NPDC102473]|uniref:hypothetical protein n=1 Tax=Streptomyces sp. NPDC102473 TaxID=3366180 RepID=UPI0038050B5B
MSPASTDAYRSIGSENAGAAPGAEADGNAATRWSSDFADDARIRIDLGSTTST